jgi:hypothetical protein
MQTRVKRIIRVKPHRRKLRMVSNRDGSLPGEQYHSFFRRYPRDDYIVIYQLSRQGTFDVVDLRTLHPMSYQLRKEIEPGITDGKRSFKLPVCFLPVDWLGLKVNRYVYDLHPRDLPEGGPRKKRRRSQLRLPFKA